tara:strand:+ start:372 stop:647 length:276 start_codon:yes stop_codon:yes gene_type:complete
VTSILNSCIKATIFFIEEALMDKFLVIDLDMDIRTARSHFEKKYILAQIKKFNGNISKTANFIGMDRTALHRKMKDLDIMPNERYRNIIGY